MVTKKSEEKSISDGTYVSPPGCIQELKSLNTSASSIKYVANKNLSQIKYLTNKESVANKIFVNNQVFIDNHVFI